MVASLALVALGEKWPEVEKSGQKLLCLNFSLCLCPGLTRLAAMCRLLVVWLLLSTHFIETAARRQRSDAAKRGAGSNDQVLEDENEEWTGEADEWEVLKAS